MDLYVILQFIWLMVYLNITSAEVWFRDTMGSYEI